MATSTSGASPGVMTSWPAKWTWKPETPKVVPAGARISAGKSGRVDRSLPIRAVDSENCEPVSCMPSPESPAKRITTESMSSRDGLVVLGAKVSINAWAWRRVVNTRLRRARMIGRPRRGCHGSPLFGE
jgi:hypothetical protein